jgi:hypothetical protein
MRFVARTYSSIEELPEEVATQILRHLDTQSELKVYCVSHSMFRLKRNWTHDERYLYEPVTLKRMFIGTLKLCYRMIQLVGFMLLCNRFVESVFGPLEIGQLSSVSKLYNTTLNQTILCSHLQVTLRMHQASETVEMFLTHVVPWIQTINLYYVLFAYVALGVTIHACSRHIPLCFASRKNAGMLCFMQAGYNDYHLQQATGRIPPGWAPERERSYSYRSWIVDLRLWQASTDVDEARQAPMVAMRLQGAAKDMVRELDPTVLANGRLVRDQFGNDVQQTGLDYLLELLTARFAPLEQEIQLSAIHDLFTFRRTPGDATDSVITRFEIMVHRTNAIGNIQLQPSVKAYMLLQALSVHRDRWSVLLAPTLGMLPNTPQEYQAFLGYLRRQGHLSEGTTHANVRANHQYWTTETETEPARNTYWTSETTWTGDTATSSNMWNDHSYTATQTYHEQDTEQEWYDADDESSGHSFASEPIDLEDVAHLPENIAGEQLYLSYRHHKRRFRHFTRSGPRRFKGKGRHRKGKGKGKSAKSSRPLFYADGTPFEPEEESIFEVYYQGSGKGKKGKGRRKNPIGKDGKIMLCSGCGEDDHFVKYCRNKGKGKGKGTSKGTSKATSTSGFFEQQSSASSLYNSDTTQTAPLYLASYFAPDNTAAATSRIIYYDGTSETIQHHESEPTTQSAEQETSLATRFLTFFTLIGSLLLFPFWPSAIAFHTQVRLTGDKREGLLVDSGAVSNLAGDRWVERVTKIAEQHGQGVAIEPRATQTVEGVGTGASVINKQAKIPVCVATGHAGSFTTAIVEDSDLPALMGLEGLERNHALIDTYGRKLIYVGPGGYELKLSPGSVVMQLEKVSTGHLLLPATEWKNKKMRAGPQIAHFQH